MQFYNKTPVDAGQAAWGISATGVLSSAYSGRGVNVAVLDTGMDIHHPDFEGRNITARSFVPDESIRDRNGHGTHCVGICCGNRDAHNNRYGVAYNSNIFAGKVLNNAGRGTQSDVIEGIEWAVNNGCKVISLSLTHHHLAGMRMDDAFERAVQQAWRMGAVCVTAAGNDSNRMRNIIKPVSSPANTGAMLTVAAVTSCLEVANFSNRGVVIAVAAPGVHIYAAWPMPLRYNVLSGTSTAAPFAAGILALLCEKYPQEPPKEIVRQLYCLSRRLPLPVADIGSGLVMAP